MDLMVTHPNSRPHPESAKSSLGGTSKRLFDIALASVILALTLPVIVIAAVALKCAGMSPIFAKEVRLGFRGRLFIHVEFATIRLIPVSASTGRIGRGRASVTRIGAFVRESGIQNLPQLVNVLRGDMSLVGPRALHPSDVSSYGDRIMAYLAARPGLIQVSDRVKAGEHRDTDQLDSGIEYVRNWCFSGDVAALLRTIFTLKER